MKDTLKLTAKGHTRIVAHRGASGMERENTLPAFVAAGNRSYFGEECDVHVTKDGKYIIYHDNDTARLCDKAVVPEETDFEELRSLKMKETDSEQFSETLKIPTLEEYLTVVRRYGKVAVIELKNPMQEKNIAEIVKICADIYSLGKIVFISFDWNNMLVLRKLLPEQPLQYLVCDWSDTLVQRLTEQKIDLDIQWSQLSAERVKLLHENGIKVNCWTCDELDKAEMLAKWGVDFITSNMIE